MIRCSVFEVTVPQGLLQKELLGPNKLDHTFISDCLERKGRPTQMYVG